MPEEIGTRLLRLPGYGVTTWEADEGTGTLTLWVHQTGGEPSYICGGCGISRREAHSWRERRVRDLPWGPGRSAWWWMSIASTVAAASSRRSTATSG